MLHPQIHVGHSLLSSSTNPPRLPYTLNTSCTSWWAAQASIAASGGIKTRLKLTTTARGQKNFEPHKYKGKPWVIAERLLQCWLRVRLVGKMQLAGS